MELTANQFADRVRRWANQPYHAQPEAIRAAGDMFLESVGENFERKEDSSGTAWPAHSPLTIAIYGVHPLLVLSGKMKEAAAGGAGAISYMESSQTQTVLNMGIDSSALPYYKSQQYGRGRIPRREFYYLHRSSRPGIVEKLQTLCRQNVKRMNVWR